MKIISNLFITGSIEPNGIFYLPRFDSLAALTGSFNTGSSTSSIGIYNDSESGPSFVDPSIFDGADKTPIKCEATNSVATNNTMRDFYNCIVSSSTIPAFSNFSLRGSSIDLPGSPYAGEYRTNHSTSDGIGLNNVITHESYVGPSPSARALEFIMQLQAGQTRPSDDIRNSIDINIDCNPGIYTLGTIQSIAERFRKIMCNCLKNGQFIDFVVRAYCKDTYPRTLALTGRIRYEKCNGICKTYSDILIGGGGIPMINEDGKSYSNSGYEVPWAHATAFNYELTTVTGSEAEPSASGELTASTTPYLVLPSAPATPQLYYPFDGALVSSSIKALPGLVYFDTNASTLFVYNGSGSWAPAGSSKYTASIGNGTASMFTVTHSKNTRDLHVTVRETSTPYEIVFPTINLTSANTALIDFTPTVPSLNQYTVIIS